MFLEGVSAEGATGFGVFIILLYLRSPESRSRRSLSGASPKNLPAITSREVDFARISLLLLLLLLLFDPYRILASPRPVSCPYPASDRWSYFVNASSIPFVFTQTKGCLQIDGSFYILLYTVLYHFYVRI